MDSINFHLYVEGLLSILDERSDHKSGTKLRKKDMVTVILRGVLVDYYSVVQMIKISTTTELSAEKSPKPHKSFTVPQTETGGLG